MLKVWIKGAAKYAVGEFPVMYVLDLCYVHILTRSWISMSNVAAGYRWRLWFLSCLDRRFSVPIHLWNMVLLLHRPPRSPFPPHPCLSFIHSLLFPTPLFLLPLPPIRSTLPPAPSPIVPSPQIHPLCRQTSSIDFPSPWHIWCSRMWPINYIHSRLSSRSPFPNNTTSPCSHAARATRDLLDSIPDPADHCLTTGFKQESDRDGRGLKSAAFEWRQTDSGSWGEVGPMLRVIWLTSVSHRMCMCVYVCVWLHLKSRMD